MSKKVYQMQNLGNLFLSYIKPNYKQCEKCGKLVKIKSKTYPQKYCNICANEVKLKQVRECKERNKTKME